MSQSYASILTGLLATALAAGSVHAAQAPRVDSYPNKPVRLIVPYPAGGANDIVGRHVAARVSERLGKPIVIDNRGGAGGLIGVSTAANAQPDGHTLLLAAVFFAMSPAIHKLDYDPVKSFERVAMIGTSSTVLAAYPGLGVSTVKELVALAKAKPGELSYGSAGIGSFSHFGGALFTTMAGINVVHVPYKGAAASLQDVIAGRVHWLTGSPNQFLPHFKSGKLKLLATGGAKRMTILPDAPTISEAGVPGYVANNWWGILAPARTPNEIVRKLHSTVVATVKEPEMQKQLHAQGIEPSFASPEEFTRLIVTDIAKWQKVAKEAAIRNE